ncbi:hypothetical protein ACFQ6N_19950 [Kitasatospora sp. NPDC056446]|uniref:hypothetical protein n=1 Tax=Kitasatospora sp. NPDC056446 TaxID=3345819 RepID=UPI0036AC014F
MSVKKQVRQSVRAAAWCALLLVAPLALAQPAAAVASTVSSGSSDSSDSSEINGPKTPEEAAACKSVTGALLGGFGAMLGNAVCAVRPADEG